MVSSLCVIRFRDLVHHLYESARALARKRARVADRGLVSWRYSGRGSRCARDRFARETGGGRDPRKVMTYERCARVIKSTSAEPTRPWSSARRSIVNHAKLSWRLTTGDFLPRTENTARLTEKEKKKEKERILRNNCLESLK